VSVVVPVVLFIFSLLPLHTTSTLYFYRSRSAGHMNACHGQRPGRRQFTGRIRYGLPDTFCIQLAPQGIFLRLDIQTRAKGVLP
ncbi:MAG: hypothetical protein WDZ65_05605, partial [Aquisalimonadaceae bacterium]